MSDKIKSVTDASLPSYVKSAAAKDDKWTHVVHIPGCYQLLTASQVQEIREIELLGA